MTDHICRNCRWWTQKNRVTPEDRREEPEQWGMCQIAEERPANIGNEAMTSPKLMEKHHCWNGLETRYDFGCVQWEGKE